MSPILGKWWKPFFEPEAMMKIYSFYHDLIAESVLKETDQATTLQSLSAFENS